MAGKEAAFSFKPGDLVLVKWDDSMVYFAKIKRLDQRRKKCVVVFDDKSLDEADFCQIHSGRFSGARAALALGAGNVRHTTAHTHCDCWCVAVSLAHYYKSGGGRALRSVHSVRSRFLASRCCPLLLPLLLHT